MDTNKFRKWVQQINIELIALTSLPETMIANVLLAIMDGDNDYVSMGQCQ